MPFPPTHWSILAQASLHGDTEARFALEDFCSRYRGPLLEFVRFQGVTPDETEDAVQEFLAHIAQDSVLRNADRAQGRFRSFLLGALKRFLARRRQRERAAKRGGGVPNVSLDELEPEFQSLAVVSETDSTFFDRRWAISMLDDAMRAVDAEYRGRNRTAAFNVLSQFLPGSQISRSYESAAADAGMSIAQFKTEVHRVRARLREALRERIALSVSAPHEVETEMAYLGRVLAETAVPLPPD